MSPLRFLASLLIALTYSSSWAINAPIHVSPSNGNSNSAPAIIIDWSTVSGNTGYLYQIDINPSFNSPQLISGSAAINVSQATTPTLMFGTTYYWRVATTGPVDTSAWTSAWSFTTYDNVTLSSPSNGATNTSIGPLLDWNVASGSINYLYEIDVSNTFSSPALISSNTGGTTSQAGVSFLLFGTTYYWRVRAVSSVDTTQWSSTWSFTTYDNVTLSSPTNGSSNTSISPLLDWNNASGATNYLYQIDVSNTFSSPALISTNTGGTTSQAGVNFLLFGTTYYWRVRAVSPTDTTQWSTTWSFTTYDNVTLLTPTNGSTNQSVAPLLDWNAASAASNYLFQVDIANTFSSPSLINGSTGGTTSQAPLTDLLFGTTYYWRVRAVSPTDTTQWSEIRAFTTYDDVTLLSPTNGATNQSNVTLFDWSSASGAINYLYQVDISNTFSSPSLISGATGGTTSQATVSNLLYGTTYYWRVRALNSVDTTQWSATWSINTVDNVTLTSPTNGSNNQSINPLLDWNTSSGATNYIYQVDVSNTFSSPSLINGNTGGTTSQTSMSNLLYGTTYYWRVRAVSPVDTTQWSTTWSFTTYDNVSLVSPANGAINQPINPVLDWSTASGSTNYLFEVDVTNTFNSPSLINGNTGNTTSQTSLSNLAFGTLYYWRVRAVSPVDTTQWSPIWSFNTLANAVHVSPSNGAINQPINPTLDWSSVSGSTSYTYQYDVTNTFSSPSLVTNTISSSSSQVTLNNLLYGTTYYWRVSVTTSSGTTGWTSPWSFTTYDGITLVSPVNGAINQAINPTLDWSTGSGTSYLYEVDQTATFNSPALISSNVVGSQITLGALLYGTTYYWRVRVVNPVDTSQWSTIWSFTTYDQLTLVSPVNGAINQAINPTLDWSAGSGTSYLYEVDQTNTFNSPALISSGAVGSQITLANLLYGTTYFWRVRAVNSVDTSQWSATWSFTTYDQLTLVSPANGAINQAINPTLDWSAGSGTSYLYEVDQTNTFNSPALISSGVVGSQITMSSLLYGTTYFWRVRAVNSVDTSQWSTVWSFTTYDQLTLVSPANGAINQAINPTLDWSAGSGTSYLYEVDQTNTFNSPALISSGVVGSQITMSSLLYGTTYFWRVRAVNSVDTSQWSTIWSFTTAYQLTTAPTLISPTNGSTNIPLNGQVFMWNSVPTATNYALEYSQSPTFSSGVTAITTGSTSSVINGFTSNTTYYWRVRASNSSGSSNWSSTWSFTTANCSVSSSFSATQCYSYLFNGSTLTTSGTYTATLMASSGCDSIVTLNLTILNNTVSTQNIVECTSYTVPSGDETYTISGTYSDTLVNTFGCDSIITINLTIPVIDATVQLVGITLTSNESAATYQWINCVGNAPISGATNQSFTPTSNGDYAVIVTKNGCSETSSCTTISTIGLAEVDLSSEVLIYPNPTSELVNVEFIDGSHVKSLLVLNPLGQILQESNKLSEKQTIVLEGTAGLYFLLVTFENGEIVPFRVVKN